jgi:hypothetical protein
MRPSCNLGLLFFYILLEVASPFFVPSSSLSHYGKTGVFYSSSIVLLAKKRGKGTKPASEKGFGVAAPEIEATMDAPRTVGESEMSPSNAAELLDKTFSSPAPDASGSVGVGELTPTSQKVLKETDADAIFRKYGISDGSEAREAAAVAEKRKEERRLELDDPDRPFGKEVISGFSYDAQQQIENLLLPLTFTVLSYCILCGVAISSGAFTVVFPDFVMPEGIASTIENVLVPSFLPASGTFLFLSVTYGLFKFAQISSTATEYKE